MAALAAARALPRQADLLRWTRQAIAGVRQLQSRQLLSTEGPAQQPLLCSHTAYLYPRALTATTVAGAAGAAAAVRASDAASLDLKLGLHVAAAPLPQEAAASYGASPFAVQLQLQQQQNGGVDAGLARALWGLGTLVYELATGAPLGPTPIWTVPLSAVLRSVPVGPYFKYGDCVRRVLALTLVRDPRLQPTVAHLADAVAELAATADAHERLAQERERQWREGVRADGTMAAVAAAAEKEEEEREAERIRALRVAMGVAAARSRAKVVTKSAVQCSQCALRRLYYTSTQTRPRSRSAITASAAAPHLLIVTGISSTFIQFNIQSAYPAPLLLLQVYMDKAAFAALPAAERARLERRAAAAVAAADACAARRQLIFAAALHHWQAWEVARWAKGVVRGALAQGALRAAKLKLVAAAPSPPPADDRGEHAEESGICGGGRLSAHEVGGAGPESDAGDTDGEEEGGSVLGEESQPVEVEVGGPDAPLARCLAACTRHSGCVQDHWHADETSAAVRAVQRGSAVDTQAAAAAVLRADVPSADAVKGAEGTPAPHGPAAARRADVPRMLGDALCDNKVKFGEDALGDDDEAELAKRHHPNAAGDADDRAAAQQADSPTATDDSAAAAGCAAQCCTLLSTVVIDDLRPATQYALTIGAALQVRRRLAVALAAAREEAAAADVQLLDRAITCVGCDAEGVRVGREHPEEREDASSSSGSSVEGDSNDDQQQAATAVPVAFAATQPDVPDVPSGLHLTVVASSSLAPAIPTSPKHTVHNSTTSTSSKHTVHNSATSANTGALAVSPKHHLHTYIHTPYSGGVPVAQAQDCKTIASTHALGRPHPLVSLRWRPSCANGPHAVSYRVDRRIGGDKWQQLRTVPVPHCVDAPLSTMTQLQLKAIAQHGATVVYRVSAVSALGDSAPCAEHCADLLGRLPTTWLVARDEAEMGVPVREQPTSQDGGDDCTPWGQRQAEDGGLEVEVGGGDGDEQVLSLLQGDGGGESVVLLGEAAAAMDPLGLSAFGSSELTSLYSCSTPASMPPLRSASVQKTRRKDNVAASVQAQAPVTAAAAVPAVSTTETARVVDNSHDDVQVRGTQHTAHAEEDSDSNSVATLAYMMGEARARSIHADGDDDISDSRTGTHSALHGRQARKQQRSVRLQHRQKRSSRR
ncbi:hypothetical protein JKP88DRAFT_247878 [Tribonema minus]|uniref:Protein kinase domain-containing protein n=1 Tax=Tribonema minus TaxID=303371 RepID=A0A835YXH4_9STRA|nr:hypothetical protein JKP88DRAFT_247878 [Tribonema minus]